MKKPDTSPKKKDWEKRTQKEQLAADDEEKSRSIAAGNREYAKLMEQRQQAAEDSSAVRPLFSDTAKGTHQLEEEPDNLIQNASGLAPTAEKELQGEDTASNQSDNEDDSLDEGILDEGGQLTPTDNLASPEDLYLLECECPKDWTEKMIMSPPRPQEKGFTFAKSAVP